MSYVYEKNCRLDPSKLHKLWSVPSIKQYFGKCVPYMCRLGIYTQNLYIGFVFCQQETETMVYFKKYVKCSSLTFIVSVAFKKYEGWLQMRQSFLRVLLPYRCVT